MAAVRSFILVMLCVAFCVGCNGSRRDGEVSRQGGPESAQEPGRLTVYSGRTEELIAPLIDRFRSQSGIDVRVRFAGTSELAATIAEEAGRSPADVFIAQDAGALGAIARQLSPLPPEILELTDPRLRSPDGVWVGLTGRARVVAYSTQRIDQDELPDSIWGFTDSKWKGRLGWPPTNGSFQAFVTALRLTEGEERAGQWLRQIQANEPQVYRNNTTIVQGIADGEIDAGFVNHYYLLRFLKEHGESFPVRNWYLQGGDAGALINVSGMGILASSSNRGAAEQLLRYLLAADAQRYFAEETQEYPLASGVEAAEALVPLSEIRSPEIDLSDLGGLEETLELLRRSGVLP